MHKLRIATKKGKIEDSLMMHNMTQLPEALFHLLHNFPFTLDLTFRFLHNFYNYPIIAKVMLQKVGSCFLTITFPTSYPGCGDLKWNQSEQRIWCTPSTKFVSRDGFEGRSGEGDGKLVSWGHHAVQNRCLHLLRRRHGKRKRVLCVPHLSVGRQRRGDGKGRDGGDVVKVGPGK